MGLARELAQRITDMNFDSLSEDAVYWGKIALLDTLGVMLAGAQEDAPRILDEVVGSPAGGPSLLFGTDRRVAPLDAALVNGTAAHALDFDNTASNIGGHVSAVMVPALIAAAEAHASTGKELLLAHAVGFETARIGLAVNPRHSEKGWHPTSTLGVFAVTAACARLLGLSLEQTETALALSTSLAAGIKANFGTMTKPLHAGQCARGGLMSALLARRGFTANRDAFEHKQGFFRLFGDPARDEPARVLEGWGEPLDIVSPGASYKLYPCCYSTHSAINGALDLVRQHGLFHPESIAHIETHTSERALLHTDRAFPKSSLEAKFSVQYCVTRALLHGKVVLEHFEGEAYKDPVVHSLLTRFESTPYTGPFFSEGDRLDAVVRVTLNDGRVLETKVDQPLGRTVTVPIPKEALNAKFLDCATRIIEDTRAEAVCSQIWSLEDLSSVRDLTAMLEVSRRCGSGRHEQNAYPA
ncbi:MAG: MmgE/PrpD family protein [Candidatus Latescibacterota bacterium]